MVKVDIVDVWVFVYIFEDIVMDDRKSVKLLLDYEKECIILGWSKFMWSSWNVRYF